MYALAATSPLVLLTVLPVLGSLTSINSFHLPPSSTLLISFLPIRPDLTVDSNWTVSIPLVGEDLALSSITSYIALRRLGCPVSSPWRIASAIINKYSEFLFWTGILRDLRGPFSRYVGFSIWEYTKGLRGWKATCKSW